MAKNVVELFKADYNDQANETKICLHESFPSVNVSCLVHAQFMDFLKDTNQTSSSIIRKIIRILLPDVDLAILNLKKMQTEYPNEYGAAKCNLIYDLLSQLF